jgi:hypothetical protein
MIQSSPVTAMFYRARHGARGARARRALPVLALAGVAFGIGALAGADHGPSARDRLAARFAAAWTRGEYARMYLDLDEASRRAVAPVQFAADYEQALRTATVTGARVRARARDAGGLVLVPVAVHTRLFGMLSLDFALDVHTQGEGVRVAWSPSLSFPGLKPGEQLTRQASLPPRAPLLARDGSVLAQGSPAQPGQRSSPLGEVASAAVGAVGYAPASRLARLEADGVPPGAMVGVSGLELVFDDRLRGRPGGRLLASSQRPGKPPRTLASSAPQAAAPLRTAISPRLQSAAVLALGGQYGGIVALKPSTGEILAVAGIGLDGLQPPGSTFKIVTVSGVLQAGIATPRSSFPYATHATLDGVKLSNAGGEECGGTLELSFAVSCNSVFAPLGVKLGAGRLVSTAEAFGLNTSTGLEGVPASTIPPASQIQGELELGSTAIGQGQVLVTPLQMALVAATIADGGRRPRATFIPGAGSGGGPMALSAPLARTVRHLMEGVVRDGTGAAAAIPGVVVAGKTGTAELKSECQAQSSAGGEGETGEAHPSCRGAASEASNTDAWFAAFAPAEHPRIAVCVLLVKDGAGGATAAPVARQVLEAGLAAGGS